MGVEGNFGQLANQCFAVVAELIVAMYQKIRQTTGQFIFCVTIFSMTMGHSATNKRLRLYGCELGIARHGMAVFFQLTLLFNCNGRENQGIGGTEYNDTSHELDNACPHPSMRRISQMTADHEKQLSLHSATSFL
jgi:hypothetical protein